MMNIARIRFNAYKNIVKDKGRDKEREILIMARLNGIKRFIRKDILQTLIEKKIYKKLHCLIGLQRYYVYTNILRG